MKERLHYGWIICISCTLLTMVTMGMVANTGFSIYMPYISQSGSFSGVETSFIFTVRSVFSLLGMFILSIYYKKLDIRLGAALTAVMAALAFVCYGLADDIYTYYIGAGVAGLSYGLGSMVPVSIVINRWFIEKRALAIGIAACGTGIATFLVPRTVTVLVGGYGLKNAMFIEAGAILAIAVVIFALLRNKPEDYGESPYSAVNSSTAETAKKKYSAGRDMSASEWVMVSVATAFLGAVAVLATSNISLLFISLGQIDTVAASAISVMGIVLTVSKILYGKYTDSVGAYRSNYIFSLLLLAGLLLSCTVGITGAAGMYASAVLLGLGFPIALVGLSIWAGNLSTSEKYALSVKRLQIAYQAGGLVFSAVPGYFADLTGNYAPAFFMFGVLLIIAMIVVQIMYRRFSAE